MVAPRAQEKARLGFWILVTFLVGRILLWAGIRWISGPLCFFVDPICTFDRLYYAQMWAHSPSVCPDMEFAWLPLQFYLHGALLRLHGDPFFLPVLCNAAFSLAVVVLVFLIARELFDLPAALAAAFGAALSTTAVLEGLEPGADCLMQGLLLCGLFFWIRHAKSNRGPALWAAAACLALGNAARFEVWAVSAGFSLYCLFRAKRWAPLAAVWAFPAFWLAYGYHAQGNTLAFLHNEMATAFFRLPLLHGLAWRYLDLAEVFISSDQTLVLMLACLVLPECLADTAASWYLAAIPLLAAFFLAANAFTTASVALHPWVLYLLAFPLAGAGAVKVWNRFGGRWPTFAGIGAIFFLAAVGPLQDNIQSGMPRFEEFVHACLTLRSMRQAGALAPADRVLIEVAPDHPMEDLTRLWRLMADPGLTLYDRLWKMKWDSSAGMMRRILDEKDNASILSLPPLDLERWLQERRVRLVVTAPPASMPAPWTKALSRGGRDFWLRADDPLLATADRF